MAQKMINHIIKMRTLPLELYEVVFETASRKDKINFCLTCTEFYKTALFKHSIMKYSNALHSSNTSTHLNFTNRFPLIEIPNMKRVVSHPDTITIKKIRVLFCLKELIIHLPNTNTHLLWEHKFKIPYNISKVTLIFKEKDDNLKLSVFHCCKKRVDNVRTLYFKIPSLRDIKLIGDDKLITNSNVPRNLNSLIYNNELFLHNHNDRFYMASTKKGKELLKLIDSHIKSQKLRYSYLFCHKLINLIKMGDVLFIVDINGWPTNDRFTGFENGQVIC